MSKGALHALGITAPQKKRTFAIILILEAFFLFTLALCLWGPYAWPLNPAVYLYAILLYTSLFAGYFLSCRSLPPSAGFVRVDLGRGPGPRRLPWLLLATLALQPIFLAYATNIPLGDLPRAFAGLITGSVDIAAQYELKLSQSAATQNSGIVIWAAALLSGVKIVAISASSTRFFRLPLWAKGALLFIIASDLAGAYLIGTNKVIFEYVILAVLLLAVSLARGRRIRAPALILAACVAAASVGIFSFLISARYANYGGISLDALRALDVTPSLYRGFMCSLPAPLQYPVILLAGYFTQGYYALSATLSLPFEPAWGGGMGYYIISILDRLFSGDHLALTYPGKLEALGFHPTVNWHSAFVWFASDISHIGVIALMFLLGFLLFRVWNDAVNRDCSLAKGLLWLLLILLFYLPANNQIFSFPASLFPMMLISGAWFIGKILPHHHNEECISNEFSKPSES
jgi:hypothetical protein